MVDKWEQRAFGNPKTKGALHRMLGIPKHEKIPTKILSDIVNTPIGKHAHGHSVTPLLKKRSNAALNSRRGRK